MAEDTTKKKTRKNIPILAAHLLPEEEGGLYESSRVRSAKLRARMLQFHKIYNAAWHVRYAQHGSQDYRDRHIAHFVYVLKSALKNCEDPEALLYAIADALTAYPRGLPWEQ